MSHNQVTLTLTHSLTLRRLSVHQKTKSACTIKHTMRMLRHAVLPSLNLLWSVILHDVGKKETFSRDEKGIHFYSHEVAGAELAEKIMMRLKFSNESIAKIKKAILNHMRFANVPDMRSAKVLKMIG